MDRNGPYLRGMHSMPAAHLQHLTLHAAIPLTVSRRVGIATEDAARVLATLAALAGAEAVRLTEPFQPSAWVAHAWRAHGRLPRAGRRRGAWVELAVDGAPGRPVELTIRPSGRGAHLWGARRLARYFAAAWLAADELSRQLRQLAEPVTPECADEQVTLAA